MNKKIYETPELVYMPLECSDVISTMSGDPPVEDGSEEPWE